MALQLTLLFCLMTALEIGLTDANRTDYSYIESTHSFYKYHQKKINWTNARSVCQSEGAILFHPENEAEYSQVLSVLGVGNKDSLWAGIDFSQPGVYKTMDGRPLSKVYNEWVSGYSATGGSNQNCAVLDVKKNRKLFLDKCKYVTAYICKLLPTMENELKAAEPVNTVIDNAKENLAGALERNAKNDTIGLEQFDKILQQQIKTMQHQTEIIHEQSANLTAALERQAAIQTAALERFAEITQQQAANQSAALERQAASETAALERFAEITQQQAANQSAALEQLSQSVQQQTVIMQHQEAMQLQAANLTAAQEQLEKNQTRVLERLALAQEKLAAGFLTYTAALHMLFSAKKEDD